MNRIDMPESVYIKKFDINVEPYIKSEDVVGIAETALEMDNKTEQEICIAVNVLRQCTDINVDDALDNMDVDYILYSGLWDAVQECIINVEDIRTHIAHREDMGVAIAKFFNVTATAFLAKIDAKLDKYLEDGTLDEFVKDAPDKLNEILNIVKEDGNADIIRGAFKMNEVKPQLKILEDIKADDEE